MSTIVVTAEWESERNIVWITTHSPIVFLRLYFYNPNVISMFILVESYWGYGNCSSLLYVYKLELDGMGVDAVVYGVCGCSYSEIYYK